jgi:uncharacterized protein YceH (UPF0502 family)
VFVARGAGGVGTAVVMPKKKAPDAHLESEMKKLKADMAELKARMDEILQRLAKLAAEK